MMKKVINILLLTALITGFSATWFTEAKAQCAMCSLTADNSVKNGNKQGETLNKGILFLLGAPFLAAGVIGFVWFKKFRIHKDDAAVNPFDR